MKTLIRHLACDTAIFIVDRKLEAVEPVIASEWRPLDPAWPQPAYGDETRCPNCGRGFRASDGDLQRVLVDDADWPAP